MRFPSRPVQALFAGLLFFNFSTVCFQAQTKSASPATTPYRWKNVKIVAGGFITGIVTHPRQSGLMYVRTDIGSSYRWDSSGNAWVPLTDFVGMSDWNLNGTESIGIDPSDPRRLYLAQGTYVDSWNNSNGAIFVSEDQGRSFKIVNLPFKLGSNDNGREAGERLSVDPNDGKVLYLGTRLNGLWKSTNQAKTWSQVSNFPVTGPTGGVGVGVIFEAFLQRSGPWGTATPVVYVGVSDNGTNPPNNYSGLYRSTDGGKTWSVVPGQPTGLYPNHGVFGPDGNLYLTYGNDVGPNNMTAGAVWKYTPPPNSNANGAGAWTNITPPPPSYSNTGTYGYGCVAVDAHQPGLIEATTMDLWYLHDDIFRSIDGGNTWEEVGANSTFNESLTPYLSYIQTPPSPGWWMGALAIDPFNPAHVLYGTGATLWATLDATNAESGQATDWFVGANGVEETSSLTLISPPTGSVHLLSGEGDIGGFVHSDFTVSPPPMLNPMFGTMSGLDFAQNNPLIMARVGSSNTGQLGAYSTDGGNSWTPFTNNAPNYYGQGAIAVSADGSTFVWSPGSYPQMFYSHDNGTTWTASTGAPGGAGVLADRVNPLKFYVLDFSGNVWVSTDGGATFTAAATGLSSVERMFVAPGSEGDLWVATYNGLLHSTNSGTTFAAVPSVSQAYYLGFGKPAPASTYPTLYLSGQINGVTNLYRSTDAGTNWLQIGDSQHQFGLLNTIIGDSQIFGRVYLGTNGRGIVYGEVSGK